MARSINCGEHVRRSDTFFVDPREIIVNWDRNGRHDTFTPESIARLALDMFENGQLQPVACRSIDGKRLELVYGYNRLRAALENVKTHPEFRLETKVFDGINDKDAFIMNLRENMIRNEVSSLDNAYNVRRLMNNYGFEAKDVAALYKRSPMWVSEMLRLLTLPETVKDAIQGGELSASVGLLLAKLPEAEAAAALAEGLEAVGPDEQAEADQAAWDAALPIQDGPSLTVDDDELAAAIGGLPAKPKTPENADHKNKGKNKGKKKTADMTPAEIQSRKTARQARISAATKRAAEAKGVVARKTASDLTALVKFRKDDLSRKLVGYFAGTVTEDDLLFALDTSESPIILDEPKNAPVKSLARSKA